MMKKIFVLLLIVLPILSFSQDRQKLDSLFPVRGLCIAAPGVQAVDSFVTFIDRELAPRKINTLVLRVDWNYKYTSYPQLSDSIALSKKDVKKIVAVAKKNNIRLIPQINLLGHQSWAETQYSLLNEFPQFDETPHVKMPAKYEWPNEDGLYCKSYCPLHPEVHTVVFALMDEICDVFEADAFHAGLDEVFYLGDDKCPRCQGRDKAELYAGEVRRLRDHLAKNKRQLWMWGDRLLEGKVSGLGMWEASYNNTHRAIDMIPKDVMICDWHYERPDKTPVIFAHKGLNVVTAPWRIPAVTRQQVLDMASFKIDATAQMKGFYKGMLQTVWSSAESFMRESQQPEVVNKEGFSQWQSFLTMVNTMNTLANK